MYHRFYRYKGNDSVTQYGWHYALATGDFEPYKLLLQSGADLDIENDSGLYVGLDKNTTLGAENSALELTGASAVQVPILSAATVYR